MLNAPKALTVLSDRDSREAIPQILVTCGVEPVLCSTISEARKSLSSEPADVVFCETRFVDGSFDDLLRVLRSGESTPRVIVCSRLYDPALYLDLMDRGAFDFIVYPYRTEDVRWILSTALLRYSQRSPKLMASQAA
jgi:DNA-binding NtrC family response regulator